MPRQNPCDEVSKHASSFFFDNKRTSFLWTEFLWIIGFILICSTSFKSMILYSISFFVFWLIRQLIFMQRPSEPSREWFNPCHPIPKFTEKQVMTPDGYTLTYRMTERDPSSSKRIMLIACPLGQHGPSIYYPLLCQLGEEEWTYITWDYRGFWSSAQCNEVQRERDRIREISIFEFASDINVILEQEQIPFVDAVIGHSMGVQVSLEFAVLYPKKLKSMILLNGSHGTVFHTAFQPIVRLPFVGDLVAAFVGFCARRPEIIEMLRFLVLHPMNRFGMKLLSSIFVNTKLKARFGDDYLLQFFQDYFGGITKDKDTMYRYIRCFEELHSHSVLHLLDRVETPTLIISGFWDLLLCPLSSYEMAGRLKNVRHVCDLYSTHATMMENPEPCIWEIVKFLRFMERQHFEAVDCAVTSPRRSRSSDPFKPEVGLQTN